MDTGTGLLMNGLYWSAFGDIAYEEVSLIFRLSSSNWFSRSSYCLCDRSWSADAVILTMGSEQALLLFDY